jgi:fructoselysine-6-P-deglycase FrlB-like protein
MPTTISEVENALRAQRESWKEVSERVAAISRREFPPEPPKRILLFGVGSSHFAARLTSYSLTRAKDRVRIPAVACSSMGVGVEIIPQKDDWAIGFSHRGQTAATLKALEICDRAGAFTILVAATDAPHMGEIESVRYHLPTCPLEKTEPHTISLTSAVCAVTTLILGAKATEEWDALRSIGDPHLELLQSRAGQGPSVLLGEWEGEWLAREASLKLLEMAGLATRAYSSEEFFHGPKAALSAEDVVWHVSHGKDPRNADIQSAYRVDIRGSTPLAWVPALVELQWLALAVALNRGVDPDTGK